MAISQYEKINVGDISTKFTEINTSLTSDLIPA